MPSEYVMYLSTFVIGTVMIASFTGIYFGINQTAENTAIDSSLASILSNLADTIKDLYYAGESLRQTSDSVDLVFYVSLPHDFQGSTYTITISKVAGDFGQSLVQLTATSDENDLITRSIVINIPANTITVTGTISSAHSHQYLEYSYATGTTVLILSSS